MGTSVAVGVPRPAGPVGPAGPAAGHGAQRGARALGRAIRSAARSYVAGRLLKVAITAFVVTSLTFFLVRLMPGNPVDIYIMQLISQYGMTYAEAQAQAAALTSIDL